MANVVNIISMSETKDKHCWKDYLPTLAHTYSCTKNNVMALSPYYLMYRCKPRLPIDIQFSLTSPQFEECSHKKFLAELSAWLWWCYELAGQHQHKESNCQRQ